MKKSDVKEFEIKEFYLEILLRDIVEQLKIFSTYDVFNFLKSASIEEKQEVFNLATTLLDIDEYEDNDEAKQSEDCKVLKTLVKTKRTTLNK